MATQVIHVQGSDQVAAAAKRGARAIRDGKLVGFATETVYGIAALATNQATVRRLRRLKSRPSEAFTVHLGRPADALRYVTDMPPAAARLIHRAWPGPVTVLLPTGGALADTKIEKAGLHDLLSKDGVIGLRCPDEPVALAMLSAVKAPVVAPSANRAGQASPRSAEDVLAALDGRIDLLIDSGPTALGEDSTIVLFRPSGWKVVREGPYDQRAIRRFIRRRLLFVCTGNTCRSPMAAGLAKRILAEREGCRVGELRQEGLEVLSAGVFAGEGARATPHAVQAARQLGVDLSHHRSRKLTSELINSSDVVLCMSQSHVCDALTLAPQSANRIRRLLPDKDVPDPIGGGPDVYRATAERIERALGLCLNREVT